MLPISSAESLDGAGFGDGRFVGMLTANGLPMDHVLFGAKRAYWGSFRFATGKLKAFGITPARLDLLRVLYAAPYPSVSQIYVRHRLGVARSVVSRMMRALEELGLVERGERCDYDRRTRTCRLTEEGRQLVARVYGELIHTRVVAREIDEVWLEPQVMREVSQPLFAGLALSFGRWGPLSAP